MKTLFGMKPLFKFLIIFQLFFILIISCNQEQKRVEVKTPQIEVKQHGAKIVFVVVNKNINFDEMKIDTIIQILSKDSVLIVKPLSKEINLKSEVVKVYRVEDISCPYLKTRFKEFSPSDVVFEYGGRMLIKCKDGIIKVYHIHLDEIR